MTAFRSFRPLFWPIIVWLALAAPAVAQSSEATAAFAEGNIHYSEGRIDQAIEAWYRALPHLPTAAVHYNLGTAWFQKQQVARAILHLERARAMDPARTDVVNNLRYIRQQAGLPQPDASVWNRLSAGFTLNSWVILATIGFWLALFCSWPPLLAGWRGYSWRFATAAGLMTCALAVTALTGLRSEPRHAIVLANDTPLRVAPVANSPAATRLPEGISASVQSRQGNFLHVTLADGQSGYLAPNEVAVILGR